VSHQGVIVAVAISVAPQLAPDRCPIATELLGDLGGTEASIVAAHNLDALSTTESMPAATRPRPIPRVY
jgi:hypothetical protein